MNETTEILKIDDTGRVRTPREKQDRVLDEFERSGLTGAQFARHVGVKYPTFMNWVQRRKQEHQDGERRIGGEQWIEAVVEEGQGGLAGLTIDVPGGLVLRIAGRTQANLAGEILRSLGYGRPC